MLPIILFLAIPVLGFIFAMKDLNDWKSKVVFIAFYTLYGYALTFEMYKADSFRVARLFYFGIWDFAKIISDYNRGYITDLYRFFVYAIVQPFTMNPKILYAVFSFIFGTFACLSISKLYSIWQGKKTIFFYVIVFLFFLHITFFNIQTTRFYTATVIFVYFAIQFFYFHKKLALIGIFATPYIHFSFFFIVVVTISYIIISKTRFSKYCYWFYIAAFILSLAKPQTLIDEALGDEEEQMEMTDNSSINRKIKGYNKSSKNDGPKAEKKVSAYRAANGLFTKATLFIYAWGFVIMSTLFYKKRKRKEIIQDKTQNNLLNFTFYLFGATTLLKLLISNGGRFNYCADMLMMFWLCSVFQKNESVRWKDYVIMFLPIKFYYIAFFFFNAPRPVAHMFWWATPISTILDGIGFVPDFL